MYYINRSIQQTFFLALLILLAGLPAYAQNDQPATTEKHLIWQLSEPPLTTAEPSFVPGELLVGFHRDVVQSASLLSDLAVELVEPLDLRGLDGQNGDAGVEGHLVRVPIGQEWATLQKLQQDPAVAFVQPNWLVFAADTQATSAVAQPEKAYAVNDTHYVDRQWYLQRINASRGWALAYAADGFAGTFATIDVAVIDSGVDIDHPEFKGRLLAGKNYATTDAKMVDDCGHGTHVAGLIGAITNNRSGIAGVAPNVRIDPRKVLRSELVGCVGTVRNVASAIQDVVDSRVDIINLSLQLDTCGANSECDLYMKTALQRAAANGILAIAAAGNKGLSHVAFPAAFDDVMAVAATTIDDRRTFYSNTGIQVEIAAPGGIATNSIYSTWPPNVNCRSTGSSSPQSTYCNSEGTSMSAAIVTGAAALLWSVNTDQSAQDVRKLLRDSAAPISGSAIEVGNGRLDLHAALRHLLPNDLQPSQLNLTQTIVTGTLPYTVTLGLNNPSLQPIAWTATLAAQGKWLQLAGTPNLTTTGSARFDASGHLSLVISPTRLTPGVYNAALEFTARRSTNTTVRQVVNVMLTVGLQPRLWFPTFVRGSGVGVTATYRWETPLTPNDRNVSGMTDESSVSMTLPFTFTLRNKTYTDLRIYSNGFVNFPGTDDVTTLPNRCLPNLDDPQQAIYGWWANLDPGAVGARVSTFQPASDRFVIEFENVPTASGVTPAYGVSFQMVLYANGNIGLNYGVLPDVLKVATPVTIGVETRSGLFYNQLACTDVLHELGTRPNSFQSFLFNGQEDFY